MLRMDFKSRLFAALVASAFVLPVAHANEPEAVPLLTDLGAGASLPYFGSDNVIGVFQHKGFGVLADYSTNPITAPLTGIPGFMGTYAGNWVGAQAGFGIGSGYIQISPGVAVQIPPISLRLGVSTNLQFNSFQWNNLRATAQWESSSHWTVGARVGFAVVSPNAIDEIALGVSKKWLVFQTALDLQTDGAFGTFRAWPGVGMTLGFLDFGISGAVARSSNWSFYADRLKASVGARIGHWGILRAYYETPYLVGLGVGVIL